MKQAIALFGLLTAAGVMWSQQPSSGSRLYLLAASPTLYSPATYPAELYSVGEGKKLQFVRRVAPAEDGVDFVLSAPGALVVGHPHLFPKVFDIIHFDDPATGDRIMPDLDGRNVFNAFIVNPPGRTLLGLRLNTSPLSHPTLMGVDLQRTVPQARVTDPLPWRMLSDARVEGATGGPLQGRGWGLAGTLTASGRVWHTPEVDITLAPRTSVEPPGWDGRFTGLTCQNERFSIFAAAARHEERLARTATTLLVTDSKLGTSQTITVPGSQSRFRLFGSWLAVLVVETARGQSAMLGAGSQRKIATKELPSVAEGYADALYMKQWLPGALELINLESGAVIRKQTGQADSEILSVSGDRVIYRVNRQIFEAPILDGRLGDSELLVEDENVSEVHWVFWSDK